MSQPVLSVVTCLFNEEDGVEELATRVLRTCRSLHLPFEFLAINDGSLDSTLPCLVRLSSANPELRVVDLYRNFGHMPALTAGLAMARGQAVIVLDGDLQDPPELIGQLFIEWQKGNELVLAHRSHRREPFLKRSAIAVFYWLCEKLADIKIPRQVGSFCLMDRPVVDMLNQLPERHRYFAGLRAWTGARQSVISYDRPDRPHGKSRVGMAGLFQLATGALFSFSKAPLRLVSLMAAAFGLGLFALGIAAIGVRLFTDLAIPGWATYTTVLGLMGFVHSLVLAVLSEYVGIIFDEVKARPLFIVRDEYRAGARVEDSTADKLIPLSRALFQGTQEQVNTSASTPSGIVTESVAPDAKDPVNLAS